MSNSVFDLKQLEIIEEENGNKYYIIPAGTKIYRGGFPADMHPNAFFGFDPDHVKQYGSVTEYTIRKNLNVLAIMEMDNSSNFYTENEKIQDALNQSYSYSNPEKRIRDSIPAYDYAVVNHICNNTTYDGYAMHDGYKTDAGGTFHAELVICDCYDRVEQGAKGEQAAPRVQRKKRPVVEQTNFYFVEQSNQSPASSPLGTPLGTPSGKSLFDSPLGTPQEDKLGSRVSEIPLETPKGFILFDLSSPDTTKSPLKKELEKDQNEARSMLFGSPQQDPTKLKNGYNDQGMKETIARKLDLSGGKRKTKRRNRKTKRRNRRTRKGGLFNNIKYTTEDVINYINGLGDIKYMGKDQKTDLLEAFEAIKNKKIEACTSLFKRDMKCEYEKIHEIYEVIIKKLQSLSTSDTNIITRRNILIHHFQKKLDDHVKKIGYSKEYDEFKIQEENTKDITNKNTRNDTVNIEELNKKLKEENENNSDQNLPTITKRVTFKGGKRKTKRRNRKTKRRRNRRTKKVKH